MSSSLLHVSALLLVAWVCACAGSDEGEEASNELQGGERAGKLGGIGAPTALIADMARELISQSYSNSQVLSLNLSNVLILLLLKAVLFSIGHFSAGGGKLGGWFGRSDPDQQPRGLEDGVTEGELVLLLSYLTGERRGDFGCLYRVACQEPGGRAPQYLAASRMLLKATNVVSSVVTVNPKYAGIVDGLEEAVKVGATSGDCSRYQCALKH